jgi:hypothetical protein
VPWISLCIATDSLPSCNCSELLVTIIVLLLLLFIIAVVVVRNETFIFWRVKRLGGSVSIECFDGLGPLVHSSRLLTFEMENGLIWLFMFPAFSSWNLFQGISF